MEAYQKQMFIFLAVLTVAAGAGLQTWRTLFNNYAVEKAGLVGSQIGVIQSVREIPGFLALLVVFVILLIKEYRLSALAVLFVGIGVAATGFFPSFAGLLFCTLLFSFGFHYYETTNQSLTLQYFDVKKAPLILGSLRSIAAGVNIGVGIFIFIFSNWLDYQQLLMVVGILIFIAGIWGFSQNPVHPKAVPQHKKLVFRPAYWLYYVLTLLAGARRQIFVAFAVFLLVEKFGYSLKEITILFMINNIIGIFLNPLIGKAVNWFGERKILTLEYISLIFIFFAYTVAETKLLVAVLYICDHIVFSFAMAIRTYFQKVADPRDIASGMAVGFTINHIAAVVVPIIGGLLWMLDFRLTFYCGMGLSFLSLIFVQFIRLPETVPEIILQANK